MHSIYKYRLEIIDEQALVLPMDSKILSTVVQKTMIVDSENPNPHLKEELVLYAMVCTSNDVPKQEVTIRIIGTGNPININSLDGYIFLNTVQQSNFMWHVYYKKHN